MNVCGEDTIDAGSSGRRVECRVVFVAMGDDRRPAPVPPLLLETDADRATQAAAEERRRARLAKR